MIYAGSPAQQLPLLAALIIEKLKANQQCMYLNSPSMVAGVRSYLAAAGIDLNEQIKRRALVLSSDQEHLIEGRFDVDRMLDRLVDAVHDAQQDGYAGLWASGDMTWEFGNEKNLTKLFEYECGLEKTLRKNPALSGVCQYHRDTMPDELIKDALCTHEAVYLSDTLSRINPSYISPEQINGRRPNTSAINVGEMLKRLQH